MDRLISCLGRLPGVGRRSSERIALKLVLDRSGLLKELISALEEAGKNLCCCSKCGSITLAENDPCGLCSDSRRDGSLLCVVEDPGDILMMEKSGGYRGRYHSLMGKISPMEGSGPRDLRIESLLSRIKDEKFKEVILALNTDVEGDATASYLLDLLKAKNVRVSRLAFGLPAGSGIGYSDPVTLARAMEGRR